MRVLTTQELRQVSGGAVKIQPIGRIRTAARPVTNPIKVPIGPVPDPIKVPI